jgi:spore coat protein CotH
MGVRAGAKRSLNLAVDLADEKQRILGYKTLNLLNSHEDPSFMSTVLYSQIAGKYIPTPKANFVRVVINGESWGVYASVQQFNKEFVKEHFNTTKGARWKVRGSPGGGGGLEYLGDKIDDYKRRYEIKSKDESKSWEALIKLCKTLNETPADKLEEALTPMVDIDGLLWFLALDVALVNNDGYWVRASDYSIYLDEKGKFHFIPHDMNEALRVGGGGPGGGRPGGGGGGPGGPGGGGRPGGGGGPGAFAFPKPGDILPPPILDELKLTEEQKKEFAALQKETDEKLAKLLTEAQRKQFKEIRDRGPVMFPLGGMGGPGGGGVTLDPLVALTDNRKPLRSKVLAVPAWKTAYLKHIRTIAEDSLDWKKLGPVVANYRKLVEKEIEADTRKLSTTEEFKRETTDSGEARSLRSFADQRRKFLLDHAEVKKAGQ